MLRSLTQPVRVRLAIACAAVGLAAGALGVAGYRHLHAYDDAIAQAAALHGVESALIRAVIWRESRFQPRRIGRHGEVGLMQVTEAAAREWAAAAGRRNFRVRDLLQPATNVQAGTWYLRRALDFWAGKPDPLPYALAEYNAGRSNALRWAADDQNDSGRFRALITYPSTRRYVRDVLRGSGRRAAR